jgi:hypothetical protein
MFDDDLSLPKLVESIDHEYIHHACNEPVEHVDFSLICTHEKLTSRTLNTISAELP